MIDGVHVTHVLRQEGPNRLASELVRFISTPRAIEAMLTGSGRTSADPPRCTSHCGGEALEQQRSEPERLWCAFGGTAHRNVATNGSGDDDETPWRAAVVVGDDGLTTASTTHACPYCELIFSYHNEVKDHIIHDHPEHAAMVESIEPRELPHD